ncbi:hypothetical protein KTT_43930 [Tengunoibacter tsumagoiensis]|uniref:Uncharacterized protein n=1 Tax=Tengunoibacter tsumagoiensis TaxID=2014871 RepID=A0A402A5W4_9CHLR|nr:hypothetical protein KTT_43930 [Tengunoibacter tsumagoiensis]
MSPSYWCLSIMVAFPSSLFPQSGVGAEERPMKLATVEISLFMLSWEADLPWKRKERHDFL